MTPTRRAAIALALTIAILTVGVMIPVCAGWLTVGVKGEWTWDLKPTGRSSELWLPGLVFALFLTTVLLIDRQMEKAVGAGRRALLEDGGIIGVLVIQGFLLQLAVGYLGRTGLHDFAVVVATPWANGYFAEALKVRDVGDFLRDYPDLMPTLSFHCRTHPPGGILFFLAVNRLLECSPGLTRFLAQSVRGSAFDPTAPMKALQQSLSLSLTQAQIVGAWLSSMIMTLVCVLGSVGVFGLARRLFGRRGALWSAALYLVSPFALYYTPSVDQMLTALCALAAWLFAWGLSAPRTSQSSSRVCPRRVAVAGLGGVILGLALFISISGAVFCVLLGVFWLLVVARDAAHRRVTLHMGGAAAVGLAALFAGLWLFTGYDTAAVFRNILAVADENVRREFIGQSVRFTYARWLFWNMGEFSLALGVGATAVFCAVLAWLGWEGRRWRAMSSLATAFVAAFVLLDISGTSMGEAGRLWMFFMPVPIACAACLLARLGGYAKHVGSALLLAQFTQAVALKLSFSWI